MPTKLKPTHGGRRAHAGRKSTGPIPKTTVAISVQPDTLRAADAIAADHNLTSRSAAFEFAIIRLKPQFFLE